jgi:hypothetical protein
MVDGGDLPAHGVAADVDNREMLGHGVAFYHKAPAESAPLGYGLIKFS